jgi:hypothetical protein
VRTRTVYWKAVRVQGKYCWCLDLAFKGIFRDMPNEKKETPIN